MDEYTLVLVSYLIAIHHYCPSKSNDIGEMLLVAVESADRRVAYKPDDADEMTIWDYIAIITSIKVWQIFFLIVVYLGVTERNENAAALRLQCVL